MSVLPGKIDVCENIRSCVAMRSRAEINCCHIQNLDLIKTVQQDSGNLPVFVRAQTKTSCLIVGGLCG